MKWVKINFCDNADCKKLEHILLDDLRICDLRTLPANGTEFLVSDGYKIGMARYHITFHNWPPFSYKVPNKSIKYWLDLDQISLPGVNDED